jgi:hypothetical protein
MDEVAVARIVSNAEEVSVAGMAAMGYPEPRGSYWCVQLQWFEQAQWTRGLSPYSIDTYVRNQGLAYGEPASALWSELRSLNGGEWLFDEGAG